MSSPAISLVCQYGKHHLVAGYRNVSSETIPGIVMRCPTPEYCKPTESTNNQPFAWEPQAHLKGGSDNHD